jgi:hypothetical protein
MPARTKRSAQDSTESVEHRVSASLDVNELTRAGSSLTLQLFANKTKLGNLVIGLGAMYWYGRNRRSSKRVSWSAFAEMMEGLPSANLR